MLKRFTTFISKILPRFSSKFGFLKSVFQIPRKTPGPLVNMFISVLTANYERKLGPDL